MPVVIKELLITATVQDQNRQALPPAGDEPAADRPAGLSPQLVEACVSQVLAVLREQAER